MAEPMSGHNRDLIEQVRKVNKLLSLYVLALQEEKTLTGNEQRGLARAVRDVAGAIEQEAARSPDDLPHGSHPVIQGSIGDGSPPHGATTEA